MAIAKRATAAVGILVWSATQLAEAAPQGDEGITDLDLVKLLNVEVSTATKTAESVDDAPAVITVVKREDIHRWGYRSVAEVLSHTVGFYLLDDHVLPNAGVRGMSGGLGAESGVVKVMIDGRSVAYRTTSGNWLGVELIPLESIAQIEIIRGPASALYGADAFLGVINIITVSPDEMRPLRLRLSSGLTEGNPGGQFDMVGSGQVGKFDLLLGAAGELADRSGLELPQSSPGPTIPTWVGTRRTALNLERRSLSLQGRAGYRTEAGHMVISAYGSGIRRGGDFAPWAQLTNGTDPLGRSEGTVVELGQFRLNADGLVRVTPAFELSVQGTFFRGGTLPNDRIEIGSDLFYVKRRQTYYGLDTVTEARYLPNSSFNLIAGIESVYDHEELGAPRRINRGTGQTVLTGTAADFSANLTNLGLYVSSNLKVFDPWLKLTGGLRYDRHSQYGGNVTGRVGLTSRLSPSLVSKLLYGNAFKAPSPFLLYAAPLRPGDVVGNPALLPQYIHTIEYQLSWKPNRFFGVASDVSYNWLLNQALFTPQGINQTARNVASQRTLTWETRVDLSHYDDYHLYGAFELLHSERDLGQEGYAATLVGNRNVVYPPWIARGGAIVGMPSTRAVPLDIGAESIVVGPRRAAETSIVETGNPDLHFQSYCMLDVFIATRDLYLVPGHESRVALRSRNLLVARGPDPGFSGFEYPLAPAGIYLELMHTY